MIIRRLRVLWVALRMLVSLRAQGRAVHRAGSGRTGRAARRSAEVAMSSAICGLIAERRDARIELDRCGRDEAKRAREKSERLSSV